MLILSLIDCPLIVRYQGLLVDMLRELSNMLGFTFTIHDNADRTYGKYVGGQWKGMIGEVILFSNHPLCIFSLSSLFSQFSLTFRWLTARQISLWQI